MENTRDFKGIWIPKNIWLNKNLTLQEKVFLVEIDSLDNDEKGCFASNQYFADFFGLSKERVRKVIASLIEKKMIRSNIIYKIGTNEVEKRSLTLWLETTIPPGWKRPYPLVENDHYNNTFNDEEEKVKKEKFLDPKHPISTPPYIAPPPPLIVEKNGNTFTGVLKDVLDSSVMYTHTSAETLAEVAKMINKGDVDAFRNSLINYKKVLSDENFFFKYKWDIITFCKKQKGKSMENYKRFLPEGDIWENYMLAKTKTKQDVVPVNPYKCVQNT